MVKRSKGQGIPAKCWPPLHLSANRNEGSSNQFKDDMWSYAAPIPPTVVLLNQDSCYTSVVTQIPQDAGLAPTSPAGDRTQARFMRGSESVSAPQPKYIIKT